MGDTLPWGDINQSCSCGARVAECGFWQEIRRRLETERYAGETKMLPILPRLFAAPGPNLLAARALTGAALLLDYRVGRLGGRAIDDYLDAYHRFYAAIAYLHGTRYVVDGSKSIGKVLALTALDSNRPRAKVVHLVRDPRGYASSLARRGAPARPRNVGHEWRRIHGNIQRLFEGRARFDYLRLRYEDLCQEPEATMNSLFEFFGVEPASVCHPAREPRKNHIIGNRMLKTFDGRLKLDTRWQTALDSGDQAEVLGAAGRLAVVYGYR
jgi:hypothetical protein